MGSGRWKEYPDDWSTSARSGSEKENVRYAFLIYDAHRVLPDGLISTP